MALLRGNSSDDLLLAASSTLCNLLLEFSPAKEPMVACGALELLASLTYRTDAALKLNAVWAIMNMAFQAEQSIKIQILNTLGTPQIFRLLNDPEVKVLMKTLGLLRNLLSTKPHIDHIMALHGREIMHAINCTLDSNHSPEVKEQALCILANIGDGDTAKDFIIGNDAVLKRLLDYMTQTSVKLQIAAIFCVSNLVWKEEAGAKERQEKLIEIGIYKVLQQLVLTSDPVLFDRAKSVMTQFDA